MKALLLIMMLANSGNLLAASEADALVARGLDSLINSQVPGDKSAAARLFAEAVDVDPGHLEAHWQLFWIDISGLFNYSLSERVWGLPAATEKFRAFEALVIEQNEIAFLHYTRAKFANLYGAHQRAIHEIDQALAAEPNSVRYLYHKAIMLSGWGRFDGDEHIIDNSQRLLHEVLRRFDDDDPPPMITRSAVYFSLTRAEANKADPDYEKVVGWEMEGLKTEKATRATMFAWQRLSIAYRNVGQCAKALTAAENALELSDFKAARDQKRYAEFCLEGES